MLGSKWVWWKNMLVSRLWKWNGTSGRQRSRRLRTCSAEEEDKSQKMNRILDISTPADGFSIHCLGHLIPTFGDWIYLQQMGFKMLCFPKHKLLVLGISVVRSGKEWVGFWSLSPAENFWDVILQHTHVLMHSQSSDFDWPCEKMLLQRKNQLIRMNGISEQPAPPRWIVLKYTPE